MRAPTRSDIPLWSLICAFGLALFTFGYIGLFTRYLADDYCMAVGLRSGFLNLQEGQYLQWTGRVSFTFLIGLTSLVGPAIVPLLPLIALVVWLAAAVWLVHNLALFRVAKPTLVAILLGEMIVFATLRTAHNLVQSFYWQSGMLTYTPPVILATFYMALVTLELRRSSLRRWQLISFGVVSLVTTFIAGAFSETYLAVQTIALTSGLLILVRTRRYLISVIAGFAGTIVSAIVVIAAPGNAVRRQFFPPSPDPITLIKMSVTFTYRFVGHTVLQSPLSLLMLAFVPAILALYLMRAYSFSEAALKISLVRRSLWIIPIYTILLVLISFVPGVYGTSGDPPWRSRFIPQFVLVIGMILWSFFAGVWLGSRNKNLTGKAGPAVIGLIAFVLIVSWPLSVAVQNFRLIPHAQSNAQQWEQMNTQIRSAAQAGVKSVQIHTIDDMETGLGGPWNELQIQGAEQMWKNRCMATYYGVDSIENR